MKCKTVSWEEIWTQKEEKKEAHVFNEQLKLTEIPKQ